MSIKGKKENLTLPLKSVKRILDGVRLKNKRKTNERKKYKLHAIPTVRAEATRKRTNVAVLVPHRLATVDNIAVFERYSETSLKWSLSKAATSLLWSVQPPA